MKLAIVHDYLNQYGGAERVVEALHEVFPQAPVYTSIYLPWKMPETFKNMQIRTSFMQKLPFLERHFKKYLMLYGRAISSLDLAGYDVVLSSSSAFAKSAKVEGKALHICYCYTPMRFVWNYNDYVEKEDFGPLTKKVLPLLMHRLQRWDMKANSGVHSFIAISEYIRKRIQRCYGRESVVIYPPVNTGDFTLSTEPGEYFLVVSRLNAYKRIDIVVEAFNELGLTLRIIGEGPYRQKHERRSGPNIRFLGRVNEDTLRRSYMRCRALVFPGSEDFGIAPVEAQACGRPVIAYAAGGALETVVDGVTGLFFTEPNPRSIVETVGRFTAAESRFQPERIKKNADAFDKEKFKAGIREFVRRKYAQSKQQG